MISTKQLIYSAILSIALLLYGCSENQKSSQLEQVVSSGQLRILTRLSPTTYFKGPDGYAGIEYDLAQLFAQQLGVRTTFIVPENFNQILSLISEGEADIAAAGLTITDERKNWMRFAPAYQEVTEQLIYRSGTPRPKSIKDISKGILEVLHGSSHSETLSAHRQKHYDLQWLTSRDSSSDELIELVNLQLIDYTIADSNQVSLYRQLYPKLHIAFDISKPRKLAWALNKSDDTSLYDETVRFFKRIKKDGTLKRLLEKNFGHTRSFDYVSNCTFRRHVKQRLPDLQDFFKAAAEKNGLDWRLLAAMGYQESHWNPKAVSPTGVRGIMMLTQSTAKQLRVKNRLDPKESIFGGARYLAQRIKKIPQRIPEPDRTWMALAAYNIGLGHLEDARVLTEQQKGNPDSWIDVEQRLPLLSKKKWYKQTKHGYARGREPVLYVKNIRNYYDLLLWLTKEEVIEMNTSNPSPLLKEVPAL